MSDDLKPQFCRVCGYDEKLDPPDDLHAPDWDHKFEPWGSKLSEMVCPQCRKPFILTWNDYSYDERTKRFNSGDRGSTLEMRGCDSGGIYDVAIACPHCDYREGL